MCFFFCHDFSFGRWDSSVGGKKGGRRRNTGRKRGEGVNTGRRGGKRKRGKKGEGKKGGVGERNDERKKKKKKTKRGIPMNGMEKLRGVFLRDQGWNEYTQGSGFGRKLGGGCFDFLKKFLFFFFLEFFLTFWRFWRFLKDQRRGRRGGANLVYMVLLDVKRKDWSGWVSMRGLGLGAGGGGAWVGVG